LGAARAYVIDTYARFYEQASAGGKVTAQQRLAARGATCFAIHQAREVADFAYQSAGANAIFEKNSFERRFRDLHTVTQQSQAHMENFEAFGQSLLGIEPVRKL
jgi:alkylation response protein AidB-like acyl-CoA dehydrogenase